MIFISVVRDFNMYNKCVKDNLFCINAQQVIFDNRTQNKGISEYYNSFLDKYDYKKPDWFVFCHEDWELKEKLSDRLENLNKTAIYAPIGCVCDYAILLGKHTLMGQIQQSNKDGSKAMLLGQYCNIPTRIGTPDCQCLIIHSSLIRSHNLRFDENLIFDLYVEDFCINAYEKDIPIFALQLNCQHWSYGKIEPRFHIQYRYLQKKYENSKHFYITTCSSEFIGIKSGYKKIYYKILYYIFHRSYKLFFQKKITRHNNLIIKIFRIPICHISANFKLFHKEKNKHQSLTPLIIKHPSPASEIKKGVIYTCVTGGYDNLIQHACINQNYDYVCFTDNKKMIKQKNIGIWKIRQLQFDKLDNTLNNRWHKLHPHLLFPKYEKSLYIDTNINFLTDKVFKDITTLPNGTFLSCPIHFRRCCIYQEAIECQLCKKDKTEIIDAQINRFKQEGFPAGAGLSENNVIYRQHHHPKCIAVMDAWWKILSTESKRDQLSLFYVLWKLNIKMPYLSKKPYRFDFQNFEMLTHKEIK